ncbi:alanine racemase [Croceicoccus pelagius]|uniref:Alanine racemase n=1 Tax=Croceicoccus pelagius TaxID=1703341 RepID=A0A916YIU3_9SPHN|nr:alanine racemase [Croceicoccus pelagius]GGD46818.1 alanine racemase, catabolic [Croceicoccus pelagius]
MPSDPVLPPPALRLRIDSGAIGANWQALDRMSGSADAGAAVKADAYGVGVDRAMPALLKAGCRNFFVAHWCEVPEVLQHTSGANISVLHGPTSQADGVFARDAGVRPVLNSLAQVRNWQATGGGACDLMVDTGMNRLGLRVEELGDSLLDGLEVEVLMSHLACADEDGPQSAQQLARFRDVLAKVPHRRASLANSAGLALGSEYAFDLTRPGLSLYGGIARPELAGRIRQVVTPQAAIIQTRTVPAGESIGYGGTYRAERDTRIAILSIGYADGYLRCWSGKGAFRHGEAVLPVLGRVSMDMTAIDISAAPHLAEGDWVDAEYDLAEASARTGLTQYELLTLSGPRLRG